MYNNFHQSQNDHTDNPEFSAEDVFSLEITTDSRLQWVRDLSAMRYTI